MEVLPHDSFPDHMIRFCNANFPRLCITTFRKTHGESHMPLILQISITFYHILYNS